MKDTPWLSQAGGGPEALVSLGPPGSPPELGRSAGRGRERMGPPSGRSSGWEGEWLRRSWGPSQRRGRVGGWTGTRSSTHTLTHAARACEHLQAQETEMSGNRAPSLVGDRQTQMVRRPKGQLPGWPGVGRQAGTGPWQGLTFRQGAGLVIPGRWWWSSHSPLGLWGAWWGSTVRPEDPDWLPSWDPSRLPASSIRVPTRAWALSLEVCLHACTSP